MANYHLEVKVISRGKGRSITNAVSYIVGRRLWDSYNKCQYYNRRQDVLYHRVFQPDNAPPNFYGLQFLCNEIDSAEKRYDARTAREFIGSLPNELPPAELVKIIDTYVERNFISQGLCAVAALHEGKNVDCPSRNNPHVHIIVSTRTVGPSGFNTTKDREHDKREYINIWRE